MNTEKEYSFEDLISPDFLKSKPSNAAKSSGEPQLSKALDSKLPLALGEVVLNATSYSMDDLIKV